MRVGIVFLMVVTMLCGPAFSGAQDAEITLGTKATAAQIQQWLGSDDPRLEAWGAHFARETDDRAAAKTMELLAEQWTEPKGEAALRRERIAAMSAVMDALIQRGWSLSPKSLERVAGTFPVQAAILAARMNPQKRQPLLESWYARRKSDYYLQPLPRVAAMLLAAHPPAGFAASVLAEAEEKVTISVRNEAGERSPFGIGMCGDAFGAHADEGWPPLYRYIAEEFWKDGPYSVIVAVGLDRITYRREAAEHGWGSCNAVRELNDATRYSLLAEMLGIEPQQMAWRQQPAHSILWTNGSEYRRQLRILIREEEGKFRQTAAALEGRGVFTAKEAHTVRPLLEITVYDNRTEKTALLPEFKADDERTVVKIDTQARRR